MDALLEKLPGGAPEATYKQTIREIRRRTPEAIYGGTIPEKFLEELLEELSKELPKELLEKLREKLPQELQKQYLDELLLEFLK